MEYGDRFLPDSNVLHVIHFSLDGAKYSVETNNQY